MRIIDFRSDTKTLPSQAMREAMANAELGDDVDGEDPTVNRLEALSADMLGKESAILVASGTQGNLIAILAHCQRGDEILVGDKTHIYNGEAGGASALGGITYHPLNNDYKGMIDPDDIKAAIRTDDFHYASTRMVALENTHNSTGGSVLTPEDMASVSDAIEEHNIALHVDGARIFNASVSLEIPVSKLVKKSDSITFCLSKGLSAPIGSVLCGSHTFIEKARRLRKMLGGGMRQAGIIAAAGIVSLETMISRLADDHANARKLALGLQGIPGIEIHPNQFPTNLVFFKVTVPSVPEVVRRLGHAGIRVGDRVPAWRLVTHSGITSEDIDYALDVIDSAFRECSSA